MTSAACEVLAEPCESLCVFVCVCVCVCLCVRLCACLVQLMQILHRCLAPGWLLVCLCLCMPAFEWCIAPYLHVPGHMRPVHH